jgi:hypothetical protein
MLQRGMRNKGVAMTRLNDLPATMAAGAAIIALRPAHRASEDDRLKPIAGNFLVLALCVPAAA